MKIDQSVTDTLHYNGKVYGFCGESCKESFKENPAKYAGK
jgi:YHS domain-containing protein